MSITVLPHNGRLRAQVNDPATGKNVSVAKVLGLPKDESTWPDTRQGRRDAVAAREKARTLLQAGQSRKPMTVGEWHERWSSDPLFETGPKGRRKESTLKHYHDSCQLFVRAHRDLPLRDVDSEVVADWLAGGKRNGQIGSLRVMFSDAMTGKAGRRIDWNPFANLGVSKGSRRDVPPPAETSVLEMIDVASRITCPSFAGWLQFAAYTGLRPGEMDGLERIKCDTSSRRVHVLQQFNTKTRKMTSPKNGLTRSVVMLPPALEALESQPSSRWAFETIRGSHYTSSSRSYHWDRVRTAMGWLEDESRTVLYVATRHFFGSYLINVLHMSFEDAAVQMGHTDGGDQMRQTYGHLDKSQALGRVEESYERLEIAHTVAHTPRQTPDSSLRSVA